MGQIRNTDGSMNNNKRNILDKIIFVALIAAIMVALILKMVPDLTKHNFHDLPLVFFAISIILRLISRLFEGNISERFDKIILAVAFISLAGFVISKLVLEGLHTLNLLMVFIIITVLAIIAAGVIRDRISPDKTDDQESQNASGEN